MTPEDMPRSEASRWLAQATRDLHAAALLVVEEPSASLFHSQQCAETSEKRLCSLSTTQSSSSLPDNKHADKSEFGSRTTPHPTPKTLHEYQFSRKSEQRRRAAAASQTCPELSHAKNPTGFPPSTSWTRNIRPLAPAPEPQGS